MQDNFKIEQECSEGLRDLIVQKFNRSKALAASPHDCFFGEPYYLTPYEMVYLICMIEEKNSLHFMPEDFDCAEFYSLAGLSSSIIQKVVAVQKCAESIRINEGG